MVHLHGPLNQAQSQHHMFLQSGHDSEQTITAETDTNCTEAKATDSSTSFSPLTNRIVQALDKSLAGMNANIVINCRYLSWCERAFLYSQR